MKTIVRTPDGKYFVYDGQAVHEASKDEKLAMIPAQWSNAAGVSAVERLTVKELLQDREAAAGYLQQQGYEVASLPKRMGAFNFAVRKGPEDTWKVVDPDGFFNTDGGVDWGDFLDWTYDLVQGAAAGAGATFGAVAGAPAGPAGVLAGAVAGAGAASGLTEGARQVLAEGVAEKSMLDLGRIAEESVVGAAAPVAGAAVGAAGRGVVKLVTKATPVVGEAAMSVAGKLAVREGAPGGMSTTELLRGIAAEPPGRVLPSLEEGGLWLRRGIKFISRPDFEIPAQKAGHEVLDQIAAQGGQASTVNLVSALDKLWQVTNVEGVVGAESRAMSRSIGKEITKTIEDYIGFMSANGAFNPRAVPIKVARQLQKLAFTRGAGYKKSLPGIAGGTLKDILEDFGHAVRGEISSVADATGITKTVRVNGVDTALNYSGLIREEDKIVKQFVTARKLVGLTKYPKVNDPLGVVQAVQYMTSLHRAGRGSVLEALRELEVNAGLPEGYFRRPIKRSLVGEAFKSAAGPGIPSLAPQWTATGGILGASLFVTGGPLATVAGAAAATPRSIVALTRKGLKLGARVADLEARFGALNLTPAQKAAGVATLRTMAAGVMGVVREGQETKKRAAVPMSGL